MTSFLIAVCLQAIAGTWMATTRSGHRFRAWCRAGGAVSFWMAMVAFPLAALLYYGLLLAWTYWQNGVP